SLHIHTASLIRPSLVGSETCIRDRNDVVEGISISTQTESYTLSSSLAPTDDLEISSTEADKDEKHSETGEAEPDWEDKTDTDGDGLPDGYEVITLDMDPNLKDTDNNGVTDDMEDNDSDGLTNYEEYVLGTDPCSTDTDEDELSDGEEVSIYNTDPLNPDSDNDTVIDSDEINFGLDPTDPTDGGTIFEQALSEGDLSVNKYNNEFQVSLSFNASNNVRRYIIQDISGYWGLLSDNRAVIGMPVNIGYKAGTIESGTITFRLDKDFVDNNEHYYPELGLGLDRYAIWVYDDEVGTILPIECSYDEENYSIIVRVENMGNLTVMDVDLMIMDDECLMFDLGLM
ncbi:MAG: hypothetical protein K2G87_04860, partial [Oscillospiraceae bacterium]|nr:hypothetical protein [Oscillospiraceae bacterium]